MASPNSLSKPVRNVQRGAISARDFAAFAKQVSGGYFFVRALVTPPKSSTDFAHAVHDTRGRFLVCISRSKLGGWTRAGWIEQLAEDSKHGKEFMVTDEGRAAAKLSKDAA